jgi:hypothetical protein
MLQRKTEEAHDNYRRSDGRGSPDVPNSAFELLTGGPARHGAHMSVAESRGTAGIRTFNDPCPDQIGQSKTRTP